MDCEAIVDQLSFDAARCAAGAWLLCSLTSNLIGKPGSHGAGQSAAHRHFDLPRQETGGLIPPLATEFVATDLNLFRKKSLVA